MAQFIIQPHFRLQEWVAEELNFFKEEGLDYEFREQVRSSDGAIHNTADKVGAYQSIEGPQPKLSIKTSTMFGLSFA